MGFSMGHEKSFSLFFDSLTHIFYKMGLSCQFSGKAMVCIWMVYVKEEVAVKIIFMSDIRVNQAKYPTPFSNN